MNLVFTTRAWGEYLHWFSADRDVQAKIHALIEDIRRHPHSGLGKPEPLRGQLAGFWSRRITQEHRLLYLVEGKAGIDQRIVILQCRYHY